MTEKVPKTASPDEAAEAVIALLADWIAENDQRSVLLSVVDDQVEDDPDGNAVSWAAGGPLLMGGQMVSLLKGLHPVAQLMFAIGMKEAETPEGALRVKPKKMEKRDLEAFKEQYGVDTQDAFDGMAELEFMEGDDD